MELDFNRFTDRARSTITKAAELAVSCRYPSVEPEVLMVSLIQEARDMAFFLLQRMNVDRVAFCQTISESLATIERSHTEGSVELSENTVQVLTTAQRIAQSPDCPAVAVEHIFWALCLTPGPVCDIARRFGIDGRTIDEAVTEFRNGNISRSVTGRQVDGINTDGGSRESREQTGSGSLKNLSKYARNLSVMAEQGKIEPAVGRDTEVRRILQILSRKTKNNPMLVGAPGTGKTAIVEGLAHRILRGDVPQELTGLKIYSLDISAIVAGTSQRGEFEDRLKKVVKEAMSDPDIVLFIDEIHLLIGGGGSMDAANILKPELARGELKVIGATTTDEYIKYVETDKAFARRFQKVTVDEPDTDSAITIMRGIKPRFEKFHRIKILDEAVVAAVKLSQRYITDRYLPDKAIDLIDEAASRMRLERSSVPVELDEMSRLIRAKEMERESLRQDEEDHDLTALDGEIASLREKENELNAKWRNERQQMEDIQRKKDEIESLKTSFEQEELSGRYEQAVAIRSRMDSARTELSAMQEELSEGEGNLLKMNLDEEDIRQVVTAWTGIPVSKLGDDEYQRLMDLESTLSASVVGQNKAVEAVSKVIRRNKMGFGDAGKPIGSFLFLGTTGVGKTELAKTLAEYLFNSREMLVRIDMSEYQQEHSVSRLFGAPPGYVGYDQGGQLTEAVRRKPYSVILLDEIEKAHPKVFETMLQVLDDGRMTDGQGRVVNFKNTIIIMTSNMGAAAISSTIIRGNGSEESIAAARTQVLAMLREKVAPEFINRIDDIVMFQPLGMEEIRKIVAIQFGQLRNRMLSNGIDVRMDESALSLLTRKSYVPEYGARPVKRAINDSIVNEMTMKLLSREIVKTSPIIIFAENDRFIFKNAAFVRPNS